MDKAKHKNGIVSSGAFSLIVPLSVEECADQLETLRKPWGLFSPSYVKVKIDRTDP